jgi:hypothetical protein
MSDRCARTPNKAQEKIVLYICIDFRATGAIFGRATPGTTVMPASVPEVMFRGGSAFRGQRQLGRHLAVSGCSAPRVSAQKADGPKRVGETFGTEPTPNVGTGHNPEMPGPSASASY